MSTAPEIAAGATEIINCSRASRPQLALGPNYRNQLLTELCRLKVGLCPGMLLVLKSPLELFLAKDFAPCGDTIRTPVGSRAPKTRNELNCMVSLSDKISVITACLSFSHSSS